MSGESDSAGRSSRYDRLSLGMVKRLSVAQLVVGVFTIVLAIPDTILGLNEDDTTTTYSLNAYLGTGFWIGIFFITNALVGRLATYYQYQDKKSPGSILTTLIFNSINILFSTTLACVSGYSAYGTNKHCQFMNYHVMEEISSWEKFLGVTPKYNTDGRCIARNALLALDTLLMLISFAQLIMSIFSIRYAKKALVFSEVRITSYRHRGENRAGISYRQEKIMTVLSMVQCMLSMICIVFGIVNIVTHVNLSHNGSISGAMVGLAGTSLWSGIIFFASSIFYLFYTVIGDNRKRVLVVTLLSLLGMLTAIAQTLVSTWVVSLTLGTSRYARKFKPCKPGYKANTDCADNNALFAINLLSILLGVMLFSFMMTYFIFGIRVLCRSTRNAENLESETSNPQPATENLRPDQSNSRQTGASRRPQLSSQRPPSNIQFWCIEQLQAASIQQYINHFPELAQQYGITMSSPTSVNMERMQAASIQQYIDHFPELAQQYGITMTAPTSVNMERMQAASIQQYIDHFPELAQQYGITLEATTRVNIERMQAASAQHLVNVRRFPALAHQYELTQTSVGDSVVQTNSLSAATQPGAPPEYDALGILPQAESGTAATPSVLPPSYETLNL